jgi:(R,R)-butanediol dehydrogenase / meso-butanediol dehydrogenase / diacetyl reductase
MRAAVYHGTADVRVEDVSAPGEPAADEILIEVTRAAICGTDAAEYAHGPSMIPLHRPHPATGHVGPMILGHEFAGRIAAVGDGVNGLRVGDRVACGAGVSCGRCEWCKAGRTNLCASYYTLGLNVAGGLAEAVVSPAAVCHVVPDSVDDESAAMAQPLAVAIHALERGGVRDGQTLAVIGVGGIGSFVVGAAAARGLNRLIAIDVDPRRLAAARSLGADEVIDVREGKVAETVREVTDGVGADVVIECSGAPESPTSAIHAARRGGRVVILGLQQSPPPVDLYDAALREVDLATTVAHVCDSDLQAALAVLSETALAQHVLDQVIPVGEIVEQGLIPLAEGRAAGKIVVDVHS